MRERQRAQVMVSEQYMEHAFYKCRPRLRTAVESKFVSTQSKGLFSSCVSVQRIQQKEASASREAEKTFIVYGNHKDASEIL